MNADLRMLHADAENEVVALRVWQVNKADPLCLRSISATFDWSSTSLRSELFLEAGEEGVFPEIADWSNPDQGYGFFASPSFEALRSSVGEEQRCGTVHGLVKLSGSICWEPPASRKVLRGQCIEIIGFLDFIPCFDCDFDFKELVRSVAFSGPYGLCSAHSAGPEGERPADFLQRLAGRYRVPLLTLDYCEAILNGQDINRDTNRTGGKS